MSGIEIDVDLRADAAKKDLRDINKGIKALADSSRKTGQSFTQLSPKRFKEIDQNVKRASQSTAKFGTNATKSFNNTSRAAGDTASTISSVKNAVTGMVAAFAAFTAVSGFHRAADDLVNLQNKLKLVTKSTDELIIRQNQLARISRDSRSDIQSTVSVYASFSKSLDRMGVSSQRVLRVTDTMQKGIALSGATADGAKAALLQFSQGLSSGTLRGEELNSVLEQLPYIGNNIAKALGKTTGELRELAATGALTPQTILGALEKIAKQTDKDFTKTAATVSQSMSQMGQSIKRFTGEFSAYTGSSARFGAQILKIADYFSEASQLIGGRVYGFRQNIKNFVDSLTMYDALELTVKSALKFEISPMDVYDKYRFYRSAKSVVNGVQDFFRVQPQLEVDAGGVNLVGLDVNMKKTSTDTSSLQRLLGESRRLGSAIGESFKVTGQQLARLAPVIQTPFIEASTYIYGFFRNTKAQMNAWVYDALMPIGRSLEEFGQTMTFWATGDNKLERAWVKLFKSSNFTQAIDNLEALNTARSAIRFDDKAFVGREFVRNIRGATYTMQDILIQAGLLDNKLIRIRDTRFDRLTKYIADFGRVAKRVYQDVFATTLEPLLTQIAVGAEVAVLTLLDVFGDAFNNSTGQKLADGFADAFLGTMERLFGAWDAAEEGSLFSSMFSFKTNNRIFSAFKATLIDLGEFVVSFFSTLGSRIGEALAKSSFGSAFESVRERLVKSFTSLSSVTDAVKSGLGFGNTSQNITFGAVIDKVPFQEAADYILTMYRKVLNSTKALGQDVAVDVANFGERIKEIFFRVYDAVVGHSYWPDLIDGVIDHTKRLFESENMIQRFAGNIGAVFRNLFKSMKEYGLAAGGGIADFTMRVTSIDIRSALVALRTNTEAAILAGLGLAFGNMRIKLLALSFFGSILTPMIQGITTLIGPALATGIGEAVREIGTAVPGMLVNSIETVFSLLPQLVDGLLGSFAPLSGFMTSLGTVIPLISNELIGVAAGVAVIGSLLRPKFASTIWTMIFGSKGKKDSKGELKGVKDGLLDYVGAMSPFARNLGEGFVSNMFASPKLAVIAGGVLSTALLDSVSLISALEIGLPLLAFALLGKDGGGMLARKGLLIGSEVIAAAYRGGLGVIGRFAGTDSLIYKLFDLPNAGLAKLKAKMSGSGGSAQGPIAAAASALFGGVKETISNFKANAAKYNDGDLSLIDALLIKETTIGSGAMMMVTREKLMFGKLVDDLMSAVGAIALPGNRTLGGVLNGFIAGVPAVTARARSFLNTFKDVMVGTFSFGWGIVTSVLRNIAGGFKGLFSIIGNRYTLFALLALGLSSTAFAASDASAAIGVIGTSIGDIVKVTVSAAAGLYALNTALKAYQAFGDSRATFNAMKSGTFVDESFDDQLSKFRKNAALKREVELFDELGALRTRLDKKTKAVMKNSVFDTEAARFATARRYRERNEKLLDRVRSSRSKQSAAEELAEIALFEDEYKKSQRRLSTIGSKSSGISAGLAGVGFYFKDAFASAKAAASQYVDFIKSRLGGAERNTVSFSVRVRTLLESAFKVNPATITTFVEGITALAEAFRLLAKGKFLDGLASGFSGLMEALRGSRGLVREAGSGIGALLGNFIGVFSLRSLRGGLSRAGSMLRRFLSSNAVRSLMGKVKVGGIIGTAVAGVGAAALWLFGPGNTFVDQVQWAYDKVRSLFGLAPATGTGKKGSITDLIGGDQEVGDQTISFESKLSAIDFSALSDTQYKVALDTAAATSEALANLNEAYVRQGAFTATNLADLARIQKEQNDVLLRMPQDSDTSFQATIDNFSKSVVAVNDDFFSMTRNLLGLKPILGENSFELSSTQRGFLSVSRVLSSVGDLLTSWPSIILGSIGALMGGPLGAGIGVLIGSILSLVGDGIAAIFVAIRDAIKDGIEWVANTETAQNIKNGWDKFTSDMSRGFNIALDDLRNSLASKPTELQLQIQTEVDEMFKGTGLDVLSVALDGSDQEKLNAQFKTYAAAAERLIDLDMEGWNGRNAKSQEDFNKKFAKAQLAYISARIDIGALVKAYAPLAQQMDATAKMAARLKTAFENVKPLGVDFGATGEKFIGDIFDVKQFEVYAKAYQDFLAKLKTPDLGSQRSSKLGMMDLEQQAKALEKYIKDSAFLETDVQLKLNLVGSTTTADELKTLFYVDPQAYTNLNELSRAYNGVMTELNNPVVDKSPARIKLLVAQLAQLRSEAQLLMSNTVPSIERLNEALSALAGVTLNSDLLSFVGKSGFEELGEHANQVAKLKDEYAELAAKGAEFSKLAAKRKEVEGAERTLTVAGQGAVTNYAGSIKNDPAISNMTKAYRLASVLKVEVPESIAGNTKALGKWAELQLKITTLSQVLNAEVARGAEANQAIIDGTASKLAAARVQMEGLTDVSVFTLDSLIGKIGEAGIAVDSFSFSRLGRGAQSTLSGIGSQLENITQRLSKASASGVVGEGLTRLMDQRQALLKQARALLADIMHATGAGISEGLNRIGIGEFKQIARLAKDKVRALLVMDKQLELAKLDLADTTDLDSYIEAVRKVSDMERQTARAVAIATRDFSSDVEAINEVFNTGLDNSALSRLNDGVFSQLSDYAVKLKAALEEAIQYGTSAGQTVSQLFEKMRMASQTGAYVAFFAGLKNDVTAAFSDGAKTAFDNLSGVLGNFAFDFDTFLAIPDAVRQAYSAQGAALANYEKALNLPGLSDNLVGILNQVSKPIDDILREFGEQFAAETGMHFGDLLKTPTDRLITSQDELRSAIQGLTDATRGKPGASSSSKVNVPASPAAGTTGATRTPAEGFRSLPERQAELARQLKAASFAGATSLQGKAAASLQGNTGGLVEITSLRMANERQLRVMIQIAQTLEAKSIELDKAVRAGTPTDQIQKDVLAYQTALRDLSQEIADSAVKVAEAGKSFASEITSQFNTGFADILKGKADEDKSVFETFLDGFLDTFTNAVIDSFTAGLLDPLTGDNGIITNVLKQVGGALFASGNAATNPMAEALKSDPADAVVAAVREGTASNQGVFGRLGSIFSEGLGGLGSMFTSGLGMLSSAFSGLAGMFGGGGGGGKFNWGSLISLGASYFGGGPAAAATTVATSASTYKGAQGFATGGDVWGKGTSTSDSINAWLSNGEFVVNAESTKKNRSLLRAINDGTYQAPRFSTGGLVGNEVLPTPNLKGSADVTPAKAPDSRSEQVFNINVTGDISQMTRKEIQMMIPQIAAGVSKHNFERRGR